MSEKKESSNIALSVALVVVVLLAGYVVFAVWQAEPVGATATQPTLSTDSTQPDDKKTAEKKTVDAVFVIDATSSMSDEIAQVRDEVVGLANQLANEHPGSDIRFGLVLYKDTTDDFLVQKTELTPDVQHVRELLRTIEVSGGGDYPEHVGAGLHEALGMSWRDEARRIIYLVGDAPSQNHGDGKDVASAVAQAIQQKIEIQTLGCSGIDAQNGLGKREFTDISTKTGGSYSDLTYHAVIEDQNGQKRSIIYEGGSAYEADRVLEEEEWGRGSGALSDEGLIKPADAANERKARSAPKKSNALKIMKDKF